MTTLTPIARRLSPSKLPLTTLHIPKTDLVDLLVFYAEMNDGIRDENDRPLYSSWGKPSGLSYKLLKLRILLENSGNEKFKLEELTSSVPKLLVNQLPFFLKQQLAK